MDNDIKKLRVVTEDHGEIRTLFDEQDARYIIPLYQRAFAWGMEVYSNKENEIIQLMDDIMDVGQSNDYYIGSLVVARKNGDYEVIDGQQRLTALFLILHCLGLKVSNGTALRYACRERSNFAIRHMEDLVANESRLEESYEPSIFLGIKTIKSRIHDKVKNVDPDYCKRMVAALKRVVLFRICVPEETDLNRYFEIMNTRGEQLEQHDIVKAMLMSPLIENERDIFSKVWNACRDMTGYVQMHFSMKFRESLFGKDWQGCPDVNNLTDTTDATDVREERLTISQIVAPDFKVGNIDALSNVDDRIRFESVIGFAHFLLHVLKVFVKTERLSSVDPQESLIGELLDDKKLIASFESVLKNGTTNEGSVSRRDFSWRFLNCLIKCRFLFDKYIIKREYKEESSDGEWSLQELKVSGQESSKRPYYVKTSFRESREWSATTDYRKENNKMIQACLRVSYTSPKVMHWITELLLWLYADGRANLLVLSKYSKKAERIAAAACSRFVMSSNHDWGTGTPHIVFNFLDYLLWRDRREDENSSFDFEFRNSVEHWHPRHPSDDMYGKMDERDCDRFGNLCLIQSNINAKFSNLSPASKKTTFVDMIKKGSLKLRLMAASTNDGPEAAQRWREDGFCRHESEMLSILRTAVETAEV